MGVTGWWAEAHAAVTVPLVTANARAFAPIVAVDTLVVTPSVAVAAQMLEPSVSITYQVDAPVMESTAGMLSPAVGYGVGVAVGPLAVSAEMLTPTVTVDSVASVPAMTATAGMTAPTAALSIDFDILPATMASTSSMLAPILAVDCQVDVPVMASTAQMVAPSVVVPVVNFDATGTFTPISSGTTLSGTHTATGADRCVLVGVTYGTFSAITASATYGGVAMTSLGRRAWNNTGNNWTEMFILLSPATGSQPVVITFSTSVIAASGNSESYTSVASASAATLAHGSSTTPAITVPSGTNHRAVVVMGSNNSALAGGKSGFTQTQRYNAGQTSASALIGDAAGAATVSFSATQGSGAWSVVGVDLIPV